MKFAAQWRGRIVGTALPGVTNYRNADYDGPLIVLLGNEQSGLSENLMSVCSQLIKLPMLGRSDSLNPAVAAGIVLYEALARRV